MCRGIATCQTSHRKCRQVFQFLFWDSSDYLLSLPLGSVLSNSQTAPTPPREGLQHERVWSDLSSCGLTKESRSWISLKHTLMRKLGPKAASRAFRKEGSRGLGWPPSSTSSSLETFFPDAAVSLGLVREGAVGRNGHMD